MICVDIQRVGASRPGKPLFTDLSLTVATGDRIGIVGLNGTGKSTLLRVLGRHRSPRDRRGPLRLGCAHRNARSGAELAAGAARTIVGDDWEARRCSIGSGSPATPTGRSRRCRVGRQAHRPGPALLTESDLLVLDEPTNHLDVDAIE